MITDRGAVPGAHGALNSGAIRVCARPTAHETMRCIAYTLLFGLPTGSPVPACAVTCFWWVVYYSKDALGWIKV